MLFMDVFRFRNLNKKKVESCSIFLSLSGVLEVKDSQIGQVRKTDKKQQNCMHWNVAPDALPGSANYCRWRNWWKFSPGDNFHIYSIWMSVHLLALPMTGIKATIRTICAICMWCSRQYLSIHDKTNYITCIIVKATITNHGFLDCYWLHTK